MKNFVVMNTGTIVLFMVHFFSACGSSAQNRGNANETTTIKVAAYNVEFGDKGTAEDIGKMLKAYDFDAVCLSEVPGGDWTQRLADAMGASHSVLGEYSTAGHKDKYKAIVSQTPLYGYEEVLMADTLHTAVKATTKVHGKEIVLYAVHFPFGWRDQAHIDETTNKIETFAKFVEKNKDPKVITILAGDFNFVPISSKKDSPYHRLFQSIGFELAGEQVGMPYDSLDTMVGRKDRKGHVIDHVFYCPDQLDVLDADIIEMDKPLSDHKPVWALLKFKE